MQKLPLLIAAALATVLCVSTLLLTSHEPSAVETVFKTTNYTFYQVEVEWPGSVCKFNNCTREYLGAFNGQHFNLHGVWPTGLPTNNCSYVNTCQNITFDNDLLSLPLQYELEEYWAGLYNPTITFHKHEWEKHGVCWNDPLNQYGDLELSEYMNDYFSFAVGVLQQNEPLAILAANGIYPSDTQGYSYSNVTAALTPVLGAGAIGKCQLVNGTQYLHSIDFCLGLNNQIADCPCAKAKKSNCNAALPVYLGEFVYPAY